MERGESREGTDNVEKRVTQEKSREDDVYVQRIKEI